MNDRREALRASCRLQCRIGRDGSQVRARIVDLSVGGLCLYSPVALETKSPIEVQINVPGRPDVIVQAEVWHIRREKLGSSSRKVWVIGAMIERSGEDYEKLLAGVGLAVEPAPNPIPASAPRKTATPASPAPTKGRKPPPDRNPISVEDVGEPRTFRVRVQARTGPRTRLLTLTADSKAQAEEIALRDLQPAWKVLEVIAV